MLKVAQLKMKKHYGWLIEEIRDVDVFNFIQDIVDLMKHIESSQEQLDAYIKEFRKLV